MNYTVQNDPRINAKVAADLERITSKLVTLLGDRAEAILLTGGFGRGEGSVCMSNGTPRIVNDYDISVLLKASNNVELALLVGRYRRGVDRIAEEVAAEMGMKQVDIGLRARSYFDSARLTIDTYEVRSGHVLLYGSKDPCDRMAARDASDLPLFEGTWLFRNRGTGLLMSRCYLGDGGDVAEPDRENFVTECNKAVLAMGDAILLLKRSYHWSYAERRRRIQEVDVDAIPSGAEIVRQYIEAVDHKLVPDFSKFHDRSLGDWLAGTIELFDVFFRYFEAIRLNAPIESWDGYERLPKPEDALNLRSFAAACLGSGMRMFLPTTLRRNVIASRASRPIAIMALLLFGQGRASRQGADIDTVCRIMGEYPPGPADERTRYLVAKFLLMVHPDGESGRIARRILSPPKGDARHHAGGG